MIRRLSPIIARVAILLLALIAAPLANGRTVELEVACFQGGYGIDFFQTCAREYERDHPNVKINLWGNPRVWEQLTPRFAAGTPPDLCWPGWGMNLWPLAFEGQLLPLDKYLDQPAHGATTPWRDTFIPSLLAKGQADGNTYLLPYNFDAFGWWYNKKMFRENGWDPPKTYDELLALGEKIRAKKIAPVTFTGRYADYLVRGFYYPLVISAGGLDAYKRMLNLEPGAWRDPAYLRAARSLLEMKRLGNFQSGCIGMNHTESQMEFLVERAAMIPCGTWLRSEMEKLLPPDFEMEFMLCPIYADGPGDPTVIYASIDGKGWCIPTKSQNPDVAADFFRYMSSRANAKRFIETKGTLMSVKTGAEVNPPDYLQTPLRLVSEASSTWNMDTADWYPSYHTDIETGFVDLYNGVITPEQYIERMEEAARKVRDDASIRKFRAE